MFRERRGSWARGGLEIVQSATGHGVSGYSSLDASNEPDRNCGSALGKNEVGMKVEAAHL